MNACVDDSTMMFLGKEELQWSPTKNERFKIKLSILTLGMNENEDRILFSF